MPRGIRLTPEEKAMRIFEKQLKAQARYQKMKTPKVKLTKEEAKNKREMRELVYGKRVRLTAEEKARRIAEKEAKKAARLAKRNMKIFEKQLKAQARYEKMKNPKPKLTKEEAKNKRKMRQLVYGSTPSAIFKSGMLADQAFLKRNTPKPKLTKEERLINKQLKELVYGAPEPRAPRAPKPEFIGPLTKGQIYYRQRKARALQVLADDIPLPMSPRAPAPPRRIRVVRGGGSVPRMPSIRSQVLANQAM